MRYILDSNGYVESVSCTPIVCNDKGCTEYTGNVPDGYSSLEEWATTANVKAYKVVNGQLVYDSAKDTELQALYESESNAYGLKLKTLWTNPSPTADFPAQSINLSSSDYDYLIFVYKFYPPYTPNMGQHCSVFVPKGYGCVLTDAGNFGISGNYNNTAAYRRQIERVSDTRYDAKLCGISISVSPYWKDANNYLIPLFVYGGKF